jgi:hypothetical protein
MLYQPHSAAVYRQVAGVYTPTGNSVLGHLTNRNYSSDLAESGWNQTQAGEYLYSWEDYSKIKQGDRLLVDGNYWNVVSQPQQRNEVYILRESRVRVEKTAE